LGAALKRSWLLGLAGAGLALSLVLELLHFRAYQAPGASSFCSVGQQLDCTTVALSHWSVLLGLPVPLWGALGFLAIELAAYHRSAWLVPLSLAAAVASLGLLGLELLAVGSLCLLCEGVHLVAFALAWLAWKDRQGLAPLGDRDTSALVLLPPVGLMLGLLLFVPPYFRSVTWKGEVPFPTGVTSEGYPWIGAKDPKLTVEEFTDYSCSHCRLASAWTLKRLGARPQAIRIVRRQYPRMDCTQHGSCVLVRMAYCAGEQGRFWQMDRWLFEHGLRAAKVDVAAKDVGVDAAHLAACMERPDIYEKAEAEATYAVKHKLTLTPSYVVAGKRVKTDAVDRMLERGVPE
jgi:uncharacterized membrane protein